MARPKAPAGGELARALWAFRQDARAREGACREAAGDGALSAKQRRSYRDRADELARLVAELEARFADALAYGRRPRHRIVRVPASLTPELGRGNTPHVA